MDDEVAKRDDQILELAVRQGAKSRRAAWRQHEGARVAAAGARGAADGIARRPGSARRIGPAPKKCRAREAGRSDASK